MNTNPLPQKPFLIVGDYFRQKRLGACGRVSYSSPTIRMGFLFKLIKNMENITDTMNEEDI